MVFDSITCICICIWKMHLLNQPVCCLRSGGFLGWTVCHSVWFISETIYYAFLWLATHLTLSELACLSKSHPSGGSRRLRQTLRIICMFCLTQVWLTVSCWTSHLARFQDLSQAVTSHKTWACLCSFVHALCSRSKKNLPHTQKVMHICTKTLKLSTAWVKQSEALAEEAC